jgi:hypothetical protein
MLSGSTPRLLMVNRYQTWASDRPKGERRAATGGAPAHLAAGKPSGPRRGLGMVLG